jgi:DNA-binding response OmpR family regulator
LTNPSKAGEAAVRVLLVEDDRMIADGVQTALRQDGYGVDWVGDGVAASDALRASTFDLVLLDLGLPRRDGLAVLRELRGRRDQTPLIVLTARDEVPDRVAALDAGADDYLVKPFDLDELSARMRSVLRRAAGRGEPCIEHNGIRLDPVTHEVSSGGVPVPLSAREFAVLEALLQRPGAVLSRAQLEDRLYGWDDTIESNAIEVYIHALRRKLGAQAIRTLRGVGYFVPRE